MAPILRGGGRREGAGLWKPKSPSPPPSEASPPTSTSTPVYERQRAVTEVIVKGGPKTARDRLLDVCSDGRYHSANELGHIQGLKPGDWVVCLRELIDFGYAFERYSNSFLLRKRQPSEKPQDLVDLLALIDIKTPEDVNGAPPKATTPHSPTLSPSPSVSTFTEPTIDFNPQEDTLEIADDDRMLLSTDTNGFVLSGKHMLTFTQAILAKKRSGKTYLAMVMAEQLLKLDLPFVVVDPTGVWGGLRSLANGEPSPYEILTLGGQRGQWPLATNSGEKVADLIVAEWPRPMILDLSAMVPEDQHFFVYHLCTRIYLINKKPVHFFFDEADEFAPQSSDGNYKFQRRCLSAVDRFVRRGGVKGLGSTLITQRPAVLNKNVLSQVGRVIVLHMVAPHDIEAVEDWMRTVVTNARDRTSCLSTLPGLRPGEAFAITNGAGTVPLIKFMTRAKETYDSSRTPTMDEMVLPAVSTPEPDVNLRAGRALGLVGELKPETPEDPPEVSDVETSDED